MTLFVMVARIMCSLIALPVPVAAPPALIPLVEPRDVDPHCAPSGWQHLPESERRFYEDAGRLCVGVLV